MHSEQNLKNPVTPVIMNTLEHTVFDTVDNLRLLRRTPVWTVFLDTIKRCPENEDICPIFQNERFYRIQLLAFVYDLSLSWASALYVFCTMLQENDLGDENLLLAEQFLGLCYGGYPTCGFTSPHYNSIHSLVHAILNKRFGTFWYCLFDSVWIDDSGHKFAYYSTKWMPIAKARANYREYLEKIRLCDLRSYMRYDSKDRTKRNDWTLFEDEYASAKESRRKTRERRITRASERHTLALQKKCSV